MKPIDPKAEEQISPVSELSDEEQEHVSPVTDDESGKARRCVRACAQAPEHEHASDVPQWVKEHENACYAAYAKQPPAFHRPRAEAWRWRARRDFVMPAVVAPFGRPELECFKDRKLAMATRRILEVARQLADSEKMTWQQKKKRRKRLLPVEVPGKVYQLFKQAFNTYKQMQPWMSDTMKLMLMREIICSVLYVEDQFSDPLFWRKVAKPLQVIGVVVHLTIPELPRAKAAEGTAVGLGPDGGEFRACSDEMQTIPRRSRPIEEDLGPPYYATYEVDAVEFSQDSIAKRFTCGRFLEDTVDDLFTGKVEHLNTKAFPFMRLGRNRHTGAVAKMFELFAPVQLSWRKAVAGLLLAVKVGDRIISRCNRRLWALRELQRLKRKKDPDAIVDVKVKVRDILNETVKAVVEARAPAPILSARLRDGLKDEEDIQDDGFEALFQHADAPDRTEDVADRTEGGSGRPRKRQRIAPGED
ncbi:Ankyrin repeat domain-containing protein 17 [Durusdinium trenchii]|uniref:Ankyrin repeat domain-containing protein 17 n=1 Tax=Durusdinium trenchii TaxID=1381693 RepID=A0ABP0JSQ8_9DINO